MPGADTEDSTTSGLSTSGLSNNPVSGGSSKIGSRPKHKRQEQIQQPAYNHSRLDKSIFLKLIVPFFRSDQPKSARCLFRVYFKFGKIKNL